MPLLIIAVLALAAPGFASAESLVTATLSTDTGEFTVGDPVMLKLSVTHPPGYQAILPQLGANWGDFLVHSQSAGTTVSNPDGSETTNQVIDARLFSPGSFNTPPLTITVSDNSGQLSEITAQPLSVIIASVLIEGDTELRDIKPQAALPFVNYLPWVIGTGVLVLGSIGAFFFYRRRQAHLALASADNRLPHEVAFDELDRVETLELPKYGRFKEHYTLVSDCIRIYMENTFHFPVLERTTGEIKANLKCTTVSNEVANEVITLLDESDLVKFSKFRPDVESAQLLLQQGRLIIEKTKPVVIESEDDIQLPINNIPSDPIFGENGRNKQTKVTS